MHSTRRRGLGSLRCRAAKTLLLDGLSVGPECGVALLSGEVAESLVEGDKAGVRGLREGQQPAIADSLGGGLGGEGFRGLSKGSFHGARIGKKLNKRVFEPTVKDCPCVAQGVNPLTHYGGVGEQAEETDLGIAGKDEPRIVRQLIKPRLRI